MTIWEQQEPAPCLGRVTPGTQTLEQWGPRGRLGDPMAGKQGRAVLGSSAQRAQHHVGLAQATAKHHGHESHAARPASRGRPQLRVRRQRRWWKMEGLRNLGLSGPRGTQTLTQAHGLLDTPQGAGWAPKGESLPCPPPTKPGDSILAPFEWSRNSIRRQMRVSGEPGATEARAKGTWTGEERRTRGVAGEIKFISLQLI